MVSHIRFWRDEEDEFLREQWALGEFGPTLEDIAGKLGRSANAVRGRMSALGILNRVGGKARHLALGRQKDAEIACIPPKEPRARITAPLTCQWLEGDALLRNFCGAPAHEGTSWCEHHRRIVFAVKEEKNTEQ